MTGTTLPQVNMFMLYIFRIIELLIILTVTGRYQTLKSSTYSPSKASIGADRRLYLTHSFINLDNFIEKSNLILSLKWVSAYAAWRLW